MRMYVCMILFGKNELCRLNTLACNLDLIATFGYIEVDAQSDAKSYSHLDYSAYFSLIISKRPLIGVPIFSNMHLVQEEVEEELESRAFEFLNSLPQDIRPLAENFMRESLAKHFLRKLLVNNLRAQRNEQHNNVHADGGIPKLFDFDNRILQGKM